MIVYVRVTDIDWDFDEDEIDESIPTEYIAEVEIDDTEEIESAVDEVIADQVSDDWGYCHNGFDFEIIPTANNNLKRAKEVLDNIINYLAELKDNEGTEEWNDFWKETAELNDSEMQYYNLNREE